jgi:cytochrome c5
MPTIAASKWYIAMLLTACAAGYEVPAWAQPQPITTSSGADAKLATGPEGTYSRSCGYCHGSEAIRGVMPMVMITGQKGVLSRNAQFQPVDIVSTMIDG